MVANMGRAKSNSLNKTPDIKSQFRKNESLHGNKINTGGQASFLGQQANMMIRGRSDKNNSNAVVQNYTSHELPSVVLNK